MFNITSEIVESVKVYEEVVQNLGNLLVKLKIQDNPIKIYETFIYMYENGFLSDKRNFSEEISRICLDLEIQNFIPMDITGVMLLYGWGVCRHTTDFLRHLYDILGYSSSQLFTYHPNLAINVHNYSDKFLTNVEAQKYIDETLDGFDLFGEEKLSFTKVFENVTVHVDYLPEELLINHTMNIVSDENACSHILDTRYHCVGEMFDKNSINLTYQGLNHKDFIRPAFFPVEYSYYRTDYSEGLELLEHNMSMKEDMLKSILYSESCMEYIKYYEEFQLKNQKNYSRVVDNINRLVKKL